MNLGRALALLGLAVPALAQYGGPAVLSRGEVPAAMAGAQISFRPYISLTGVYDSGLATVGVDSQGDLGNASAYGMELSGGISGAHSWRHSTISLDYKGSVREYNQATYFDGTDQRMLLGITHQFTRHVMLTLRETGGTFSRGYGNLGLTPTANYDPSQSYIPTTSFFDNSLVYLTTQADLVIQKTARLSFDFGGDYFLTKYRSSALYDTTGVAARGDVQYRLSRRSTIGAMYSFTHFAVSQLFSNTDVHSVAGAYALRLTRTLEFSGYAGASRLESNFIQTVPADPAVTALLGITQGTAIVYRASYTPLVQARLSQTFHRGVAYLSAGHMVVPGNGLFLTSTQTMLTAGYTYTGLRRWSFNASGMYSRANSIANVVGNYGDEGGSFTVSRELTRSVHAILAFYGREYTSASFAKYNRPVYETRIGLGFAPGEVPLRIW